MIQARRALVAMSVASSAIVACESLEGLSSGSVASRDAGGAEVGAPPQACPSAGHARVPRPALGWSGPVWLYNGNPANVPGCPPEMAITVLEGHDLLKPPAPATCSPCICESPAGVTCGPITRRTYTNDTCTS